MRKTERVKGINKVYSVSKKKTNKYLIISNILTTPKKAAPLKMAKEIAESTWNNEQSGLLDSQTFPPNRKNVRMLENLNKKLSFTFLLYLTKHV